MQFPSLFESLFKKNPDDAGNVDFLKRLVEQHPYFTPAQFYLLQQKNSLPEDDNNQACKTAVLFNNTYWLNFQLLKMQEPANNALGIFVSDKPFTYQNTNDQTIVEQIPYEHFVSNTVPDEQAVNDQTLYTPFSNDQPLQHTNNNGADNNGIHEEIPLHSADEPLKETTIPQIEPVVEDKMIFEPLYATDYFLSQGIKLSEENLSNDKLGKQLKSFTDWLKTMKKINSERIQIDHSAPTDTAVQQLAEKSNTEGEVLTETMAEIFIQQGKTEKAAETYQKLSLLNPAKSAYFAAKIDQLKEQ